jgi:hypothetical protein
LMHARRRTSAAHVPGTLPRSLRDHTTRHSRHIHPPAGCRGTRRGAAADARLCGPGCSNTAPPAGPARRTAGRRAHSTTPVPSWSCRGRDPAPAPWCRRHAPAPPTSRAAPPPRPADASAVRSVRPSPPASSGRGRCRPARRSPPGDTAASESRGGVSPPRAPRTVREPLGSYGSQCSAPAIQKRPMGKQVRR